MEKIIMRSDNPECDWPEDFKHENGNYQCHCVKCDKLFFGHKRRVECKACAYPASTDDPKLDFSDLFHYVKSIKQLTNMTDEEADTLYHVLDMWEKKRYFEPTQYLPPEMY